MTTPDLATRVKGYFHRQIAWLEERLAELEQFDSALREQSIEKVGAQQARREAELVHLTREHRGLLHEWRSAKNIAPNDRALVRELAERAQTLTEQLQSRYEGASQRVQTEMERHGASLKALHRGRTMLRKFRPGGGDQAGFIDTKA